MSEQMFFNDITCGFNLRKPNKNKATNIYLVVYINGKQYKISTGVKVNPRHWNKNKQNAYIGFRLTSLDNGNNLIVNERLEEIKKKFQQFKAHICNNPSLLNDAPNILRGYIVRDKKINGSAIRLLLDAFGKLYPTPNSTERVNRYRLNHFINYVKENGFKDTPNVILTQVMLDKYKSHLINQSTCGVGNINDKCEIIVRLINHKIAVADEYKQYNITRLEYVKVKDKRKKEDTKKTALTDSEVMRIKEVKLLPKLDEYRDVFVMLLYCGMRVSDVNKVFNADIRLDNDEEEEYIILTQKERVEAVITFTKDMKDLVRKYRNGFRYVHINASLVTQLDKHIKEVAKLAKLNRLIEWREQYGENNVICKSAPLCDIISSHYARHTFITNKILQGWQADKLCYASGHIDDKMIKQIYTHLTRENKINIVREEKKRVNSGIS